MENTLRELLRHIQFYFQETETEYKSVLVPLYSIVSEFVTLNLPNLTVPKRTEWNRTSMERTVLVCHR